MGGSSKRGLVFSVWFFLAFCDCTKGDNPLLEMERRINCSRTIVLLVFTHYLYISKSMIIRSFHFHMERPIDILLIIFFFIIIFLFPPTFRIEIWREFATYHFETLNMISGNYKLFEILLRVSEPFSLTELSPRTP